MENKGVTHSQVGEFYNTSIIAKFWGLLKKKQMHVGYWDDKTPFKDDLYEGAKRFSQYMIDHTDVKAGESFIDIGCGFGEPAMMLAEQKNCSVYGVTASETQRETAVAAAAARGLSGLVTFDVADANDLPCGDGLFDGGWFFESIFHMGHESALREAYRVLKPGATVLIADFVKTGDLSERDREFLRDGSGIKTAVEMGEYDAMLDRLGFDLEELRDITGNTIDRERRWGVHLDIINAGRDELLKIGSEAEYEYLKEYFGNLNRIGKSSIGYCFVKARKKPA